MHRYLGILIDSRRFSGILGWIDETVVLSCHHSALCYIDYVFMMDLPVLFHL